MPAHYEPTGSPPIDPLAPLVELVDKLLSSAFHVGLGLAAGSVAVTLMRRHHLRWTWAASSLVLIVPARPLLADWSYTLGAAALCAAARGRGRHREDLEAGADLAEIARSRRGPLRLLRFALLAVRERIGVAPERRALTGERMPVGRDAHARTVSIPLGSQGGRHTLIVGATGSGKTVTQTWIVCRAVQAGLGAVVIDPKGDARMREHLVTAARECGREFLEWTPTGPSVYNPFGHGGASEIADKALAGERFTEPHYQRQAQRYLGHAVRALRCAGLAVSFPALVAQLDPNRLYELAESLPGERARATCDYLASLTARQRAELGGVRDRLAIVAESDVARWLDPATDSLAAFDLLSAVRRRAVIYFALDTDSFPLLAQMLGAAIVGDLRTAMAALQRSPVATVVAIDEFAALAAGQVAHLFARARSAGIHLLLGTQELSDLRIDARGGLLEQVLGNLSALIAHRQVVIESAELLSRLAGSRGAWRTTHSSDGRWTRTRSIAPAIAPEAIRGLPPGFAAIADLGAGGQARIAEVFSSAVRIDR